MSSCSSIKISWCFPILALGHLQLFRSRQLSYHSQKAATCTCTCVWMCLHPASVFIQVCPYMCLWSPTFAPGFVKYWLLVDPQPRKSACATATRDLGVYNKRDLYILYINCWMPSQAVFKSHLWICQWFWSQSFAQWEKSPIEYKAFIFQVNPHGIYLADDHCHKCMRTRLI